jgi:hypothetical protein
MHVAQEQITGGDMPFSLPFVIQIGCAQLTKIKCDRRKRW